MSATTTGPRPSPALFLPYEEGGTWRPATTNDRNRVFSLPGRISSISPLGVEESSLRLGVPALDAALQGGLAAGALHELAPTSELQLGAAFGFGLALATLAAANDGRQVLCITTEFAAREGGAPYGVGLDLFGLSLERLLILRVAHPRDALWGFEEGLKCRALMS